MLCELAHRFPPFVAAFLERELSIPSKRRFREETITDLLTFSLLGLERFGIQVDLPLETKTGADMDWHFVAPRQIKGGRYARLLIQAKRALCQTTLAGDYWYYNHLDHLHGKQASDLMSAAAADTLALYALYHPSSALAPPAKGLPAVEGVNFVEVALVAPVVKGGCKRRPHKTLERWRPFFMPLSSLLCRRIRLILAAASTDPTQTQFLIGDDASTVRSAIGEFHPLLVARELDARRLARREARSDLIGDAPFRPLEPSDDIPTDIARSIRSGATEEDRARLARPRVVFWTDAIADEYGALHMPDR